MNSVEEKATQEQNLKEVEEYTDCISEEGEDHPQQVSCLWH